MLQNAPLSFVVQAPRYQQYHCFACLLHQLTLSEDALLMHFVHAESTPDNFESKQHALDNDACAWAQPLLPTLFP